RGGADDSPGGATGRATVEHPLLTLLLNRSASPRRIRVKSRTRWKLSCHVGLRPSGPTYTDRGEKSDCGGRRDDSYAHRLPRHGAEWHECGAGEEKRQWLTSIKSGSGKKLRISRCPRRSRRRSPVAARRAVTPLRSRGARSRS